MASMTKTVRAGVVGAGVFGGFHAGKYAAHDQVDLVGIYEPNIERAKAMADKIGGTTFSFDLPVGHPLEDEVAGFLSRTRLQMEDWLERVRAVESEDIEGPRRRVTIYAGQMVEDL